MGGHEIESFCVEVTVPPVISVREHAMWCDTAITPPSQIQIFAFSYSQSPVLHPHTLIHTPFRPAIDGVTRIYLYDVMYRFTYVLNGCCPAHASLPEATRPACLPPVSSSNPPPLPACHLAGTTSRTPSRTTPPSSASPGRLQDRLTAGAWSL